MHQASQRAGHTLVVLSDNYLRSEFARSEAWAALARDPVGREDRVVTVKVGPTGDLGLFSHFAYLDLTSGRGRRRAAPSRASEEIARPDLPLEATDPPALSRPRDEAAFPPQPPDRRSPSTTCHRYNPDFVGPSRGWRCQLGCRRASLMPTFHPDRTSGSTGDAGDIMPDPEGAVTGGAMVGCGQQVATELEEVVDLAVAGEKALGMAR